MEIVSKKTSLNMNQITAQKTESYIIESDAIIPDIKPDILNTITTSGNVCVYKKEINNKKLRFDGTVQTYIMYLADEEEGKVRGLQTNIDFSEDVEFEKIEKNSSSEIDIKIKGIECNILNGRKIHVKAIIEVNATIYKNNNIEVIKELNEDCNIQKMSIPTKISSLVGEGNTKITAKDTFMIDNADDLAEILKAEVKLVNKEYKISYNKVLLKADLIIKILYLTEDRRIKNIENRIPVMGFVDIKDVKEEDFCDVKYEMKNIILKPNSIEEHSIYAECEIEAELKMYHNEEVELIQDLYSTENKLKFESNCIKVAEKTKPIQEKFNLEEKEFIEELENKVIYDTKLVPKINDVEKSNGKIQLIGEVEIEFIYRGDNSSSIDNKRITIPFEHIVENERINISSKICSNIDIVSDNFIVEADNKIYINLELEIKIEISNLTQLNLLDNIEVSDEKLEKHGMVIYFTKTEDSLWDIAKRFCSTIDDIKRVNKIEENRSLEVRRKTIYTKLC